MRVDLEGIFHHGGWSCSSSSSSSRPPTSSDGGGGEKPISSILSTISVEPLLHLLRVLARGQAQLVGLGRRVEVYLLKANAFNVRHVLQRKRDELGFLALVRVAERVGRVVVQHKVALLPEDAANAHLHVAARLLQQDTLDPALDAALVPLTARSAFLGEACPA